jgi:protein-tyrosine phosphatase
VVDRGELRLTEAAATIADMEGPLQIDVEATEPESLTVRWEPAVETEVEIGLGPTPDAAAHTHVIRVPAGERSARLTGVGTGRQYVSVTYDGTRLVAAERRVRFVGTLNFRDLGGYPTASGGWTRWGLLYRSSNLHRLTVDDLTAFDSLGVRAIFDLRRDDERAQEPGPRPARGLPMPTRYTDMPDLSRLRDRADGERWLFDEYQTMLAEGGPIFGTLLTALAEADGTPAVFHCAGGKDRTGMSAALLLSWLGVDRETVLDDYELTNRFQSAEHIPEFVDLFMGLGITRPAAEGLLSSPRWAMTDALDLMDSDYGGIESYLRGPAAMTDAALTDLRRRFVA